MRVPTSVLRQSLTVEDYLGEGAYGPAFGPAREMRASVQQTGSVLMEWKNEQIVVNSMVIIRPEDGPVAPGSKATIGADTFRVVKSFAMPDAFRPTHWELMVYSWGVE